jgi:hypothetical protein
MNLGSTKSAFSTPASRFQLPIFLRPQRCDLRVNEYTPHSLDGESASLVCRAGEHVEVDVARNLLLAAAAGPLPRERQTAAADAVAL